MNYTWVHDAALHCAPYLFLTRPPHFLSACSVKSKWAAWEYPGDHGSAVGGYITRYDHNFSFATVRGAGHMVPETRPQAAYHMFANFLEGKL